MSNFQITKIEKRSFPKLKNEIVKKRVAVYTRVSTSRIEQQSSIKNQNEYYVEIIEKHPDWVLANVYEDNGITGTDYHNRESFLKMISDCEAGKVDIVVTKSVSRFARNTVDSLNTIRKLKRLGINIYFEKEDIWTLDGKGEFLITLMSCFAQEESKSISENTAWGVRKRMADGVYSVPSNLLGYEKGPNGEFVINKQQAKLVKKIYKLFLQGMSGHSISKLLTSLQIPTPLRRDSWYQTTVINILTNEKYKGDALLQKAFTVDFLTKKQIKNRGELPQYYVTAGHEPIIPPYIFDEVQSMLAIRKNGAARYMGISAYSNKVYCGMCGTSFGSKRLHSTTTNDLVWMCNGRYSNLQCRNFYIYDEHLRYVFAKIQGMLLKKRKRIMVICNQILKELQLYDRIYRAVKEYPTFTYDDIMDFSIIMKAAFVYKDRMMKFTFIDGTKITYELELYTPRRHRILEVANADTIYKEKVEQKWYCDYCGIEVEQNPKRKRKRFCSDKCRNQWWNQHVDQVKKSAYYNFVCEHCGKEFVAYGNKGR